MINLEELLDNPSHFQDELKSELPFLFPNNDMAKAQWNLKLLQFQANNQNLINRMNKELRQVDILKQTKVRLESLVEAYQNRENEIKSLFEELNFKSVKSEKLTQLLSNRIPSRQHVESYYLNIFRDWAWGETENAHYNKICEKADLEAGNVLVMGGGAGRLAYDLCQIFDHWNVVQLDINPLLSLIGKKMADGEKLSLTEIAVEPLSSGLLSEIRELQGLGHVPGERLRYVLGDASNPPFKAGAFDGLVTPWLIDIIPEPFDSFSRRCNQFLKDGAEWINFGPLSFEKQSIGDQFTSDEVLEQLKHAGFELVNSGWEEVPYLNSPIRAQMRKEKIFWFHAKKIKACKQPSRYHFYPDWFEDPEVKVPLATTNIETLFAQKNLEANILGSLAQGKSISELIKTLTVQANMSVDEAESLIIGNINRLIEEGEIVSK